MILILTLLLSLLLLSSCGTAPSRDRLVEAYAGARSARDAGDNVQATLRFREVLRLSQKAKDNQFEGYACQQLSLLYAGNYDHQEALKYACRAVTAFEEAQDTLAADYSRIDIARQYFSMNRKADARHIADSLLSAVHAGTDAGLLYYLYDLKADLEYHRKNYPEAGRYYRKVSNLGFPLTVDVYSQAALTEEHLGHREVADTLLPLALRHVASSIDSVTFFNAIHEIHALRGEFRKAYEALSVATEIQGRVVSTVLSRSLTHAMQAYFEEQYKLEKSRRQTACILIFLVLVDLASVILLTTSTLRQSRQKIIAEMERADSLSRDLQHITLLRQGADAALSTLVEDKIKTMQGLADTYLSWSDRAVNLRDEQKGNALREDIISSFRSELRSLRSDEHLIPSIESALNTSGNRLMSRLRSDFSGFSGEPRLKEMDYQLLSLFFAGFSTKSIGFMLDMSDEAVRTRKYRYRKLFSSLPGPNMQEYYRRLSK